MTEFVIFFATQQNAGENIVNFAIFTVRQTNDHFSKKIWIQVKINMLLSVFRRIKQLCTAAFLKLKIEQQNICRIEIICGQLEKNIVGLLKRLIFSQAII